LAKVIASAGSRYVAATLALLALAACGDRKAVTYQGYVEGEFVYVGAVEAGRLDRLLVARGQQVAAGTRLFVLESARANRYADTAALCQALGGGWWRSPPP
jgi:HlyD family secretion protein